ncbi:deoxynucleotidyltransferase terminal-interacting protein 2 [Parus major]|uniref:deoxynucleotidyltransferase terminal-interacting protein 2 n=1 Tax=Parus major TaxID=9157 RepID=UPI0007715FFF|nr:deoxynucleotidyltransferase terminal-interacting protein 2 [Parus major]
MVNTRRGAARRRQQGARAGGGSSPGGPDGDPDGGAAEVGSAEISTPVTRRMTRRTKSVRKPEVIQESQFEELEHAEIKSDVSDSSEMQITGNESTAVQSAQSVAEPQVDGDVSEAESNCSSMSGLQTPLLVRITRRRQIVIPYQPESADKKKDNTAFVNKLSRILDEDDVSEAESCCSAVSGVQMPNVPTSTRSRQSKKKLQAQRVCEAQSEDTSDAVSCYLSSHVEPSVTTKRITRSMQIKSHAENTKQTEKKIRFVSEDENLFEDTVESEPTISDFGPTAELVSDTEDASTIIDSNTEPSPPKSKCASKCVNAPQSEDMKEEILNDVTSSLTKTKQSNAKSPVKKQKKNTQSVETDHSEAICGQIQADHSKILGREGKLERVAVSLTDCMSPKKFLESQGQETPNESKKIAECERADAEADAQQSLSCDEKLRNSNQTSAVSSPSKDMAVTQTTESIDKSRMCEIGADSGDNQTKEYVVSHSSKKPSSDNDSVALFLSESDDSENSDVADIDTVNKNLCYKKSDERTPSFKKSLKSGSLHVEGLFVIDTEPGMSSSQKYYLDDVDQDSGDESKHEGDEKDKELDLEEDEEELIDEDEKDEDDDMLKSKADILHLSSSIDPGLNIKKLGGLYISFDAKNQKSRSSVIKPLKEKKDQLLQKSIITPDFERKECVPPYKESLHQLKKQRRAEREKTAGDGWFGMKAPEITSELKNDLKVLKMRASLDPKHFYKKNDRDGLPKYFQVGTVVDSPIDFYHSRIPKKQRKRTIVEELLADSEFRRYNKKKYQEIMSEKAAFAAGKRNRKKKKFHN